MLRENYVAEQQLIGQRLTRAMAKAHMDRRELIEGAPLSDPGAVSLSAQSATPPTPARR